MKGRGALAGSAEGSGACQRRGSRSPLLAPAQGERPSAKAPSERWCPAHFKPRGCFLGLREMREGTSCKGAGYRCRAAPVTPNSDRSPAGHLAVRPPGQPRAQRDLTSSSTTRSSAGRQRHLSPAVTQLQGNGLAGDTSADLREMWLFCSFSHAIKTNLKEKLNLVPNEGSCLESELKYFISSLNFCSIGLVPSRVLLNHFS